ncbi:MAG: VacJ family lipoprotein, partial [Alphaproteobacteria bacterium]
VLKPASELYVAATPELFRYLLANGVSNLGLPVDAANQLMQGRFMDALATVGRFGVNTVFGAAGLLDPATDFGLPREPADFGQTLYVWGVPEGAYVELPIFGPSTRRDAVGRVVDYIIDPTTYFGFIVPNTPAAHAFTAVRGLDILNRRAQLAPQLDPLLYSSADSYTELKNSYVQLRRRQLGMEEPADAALPDIFEDPAATQ